MVHIFRDVSFDAASQHCDADCMNVSPTSMPRLPTDLSIPPPPPARPCSIGELATRFDQQSLQVDVDPAYAFASESPNEHSPVSPTNMAFPPHLLEPAPPSRYSSIASVALRKQRQSSSRLLYSSSSHLKDISSLIQNMVESGEQCHVHSSNSLPSPTSSSSDEDEGLDMDYTPSTTPLYTLSYRRAADCGTGCTGVPNSIRMRKRSRISKRPCK